jgi:hypothetical protein
VSGARETSSSIEAAQAFMSKPLCPGLYVQAFMSKPLCPSFYVYAFMSILLVDPAFAFDAGAGAEAGAAG